jgi:hypothetical protein
MTSLRGSGVKLRRVKHSHIKQVAKLTDVQLVINAIFSTSTEMFLPYYMGNTKEDLVDILSHAPPEASRKILVIADIQIEPSSTSQGHLSSWAICSIDIELSMCFVAREGLSGTLVLASPGVNGYQVVAYLTMTDTGSISYLLKMDEQGNIEMPVMPILLQRYDAKDLRPAYIEEETITAF